MTIRRRIKDKNGTRKEAFLAGSRGSEIAMIADNGKLRRLLADIRTFASEFAIPEEDRVEAEDRVPDHIVSAGRRLRGSWI